MGLRQPKKTKMEQKMDIKSVAHSKPGGRRSIFDSCAISVCSVGSGAFLCLGIAIVKRRLLEDSKRDNDHN
jgi:hypothetical protein